MISSGATPPQIVGIGFGHFAALAVLARWDGWKLSRPLGEDGAVAFVQRLVLVRAQHLVVSFRDLMTGAKEQPLHTLGPRVIMSVDDEGELAQQMCPAQRVVTVRIAQIRGPAVVHRHTGVAREDADGLDGLAPALGVEALHGEWSGAGRVAPGDCSPEALSRTGQGDFHHRMLSTTYDGVCGELDYVAKSS